MMKRWKSKHTSTEDVSITTGVELSGHNTWKKVATFLGRERRKPEALKIPGKRRNNKGQRRNITTNPSQV